MKSLSTKPRVLVLIDRYFPGYRAGGMIRSVAATVSALSTDIEFLVVTSDRDMGEATSYPNVRADAWNTLGDGTRVFYCSSKVPIKDLLCEESPDLVYIQGVFSYNFSIRPLRVLSRVSPRPPVLLAARGMLDAHALTSKAVKKRTFILAAKLVGLYREVTWHASSEREASAIRAVFGERAKIEVAMDVSKPALGGLVRRVKQQGRVRLLFLSRIVRNKNLLEAIRIVKQVSSSYSVHLDILGPVVELTYWKKCLDEMRELPEHVTIEYQGAVEYQQVPDRMEASQFLLLPTRFENFGHVVLESLAAGCPVIISDQTPWRGLNSMQLGWDIPLTQPEAFVGAVEEAAAMDQEAYWRWSQAAHRFANTYATNSAVLASHRDMFLRVAEVS